MPFSKSTSLILFLEFIYSFNTKYLMQRKNIPKIKTAGRSLYVKKALIHIKKKTE